MYRATPTAQEVILRYCFDIFLRKNIDGVFQDSVQTVEDLCFFAEWKLFVGKVSPEMLLAVDPFSKEFEGLMQQLGKWDHTDQLPPILGKC